MTAATVAAALGGAYRSGEWWRCRCPVHGSRGASLALKDGNRSLIVKCWGPCAPGQVLAELRSLGLTGDSGAPPPPDPEEARRQAAAEAAGCARRVALARDMWRAAWPAAGTMAEAYLRARLPGLAAIPPTIRYLPRGSPYARHPEGTGWPVMLAAVKRVGEAGIVAAHRTWLSPDGGGRKAGFEAPRRSTGPVGGGAVRLAALRPDAPLLVAEGIETTLAAMIATGWPGWAALSAGGIEHLILPEGVRDIVIAADHDESGAGERAARAAALRWAAGGRQVEVYMAPRVGADAADLLAAGGVRHAA